MGESTKPMGRSNARSSHKQTRDHSQNSSDESESNDSDNVRSRRSEQRTHRPKNRRNLSKKNRESSSDNNESWNSDETSSPTDDSVKVERGRTQLRIKLQQFDGTGSWESWWAHFQNCAKYNEWTKRDKLAFLSLSVERNSYGNVAGWLAGCLSHSGIVSKPLNLSENFFDHLKAPSF